MTIDAGAHVGLAVTIARDYRGADPDDLRQEAALAVVVATRTYDPALGAFGPYAATAARRACLRVVRRERSRPAHVPLTLVVENGEEVERRDLPHVEASAYDDVLGGELERLLAALPDREREVLVRRSRDDTLEAIGAVLGLSRQRVAQLEARGLATLRRRCQVRRERHGRVTLSQVI